MYTKRAPTANPKEIGRNVKEPYNPDPSAISMAGDKSDQYEAASITCRRWE